MRVLELFSGTAHISKEFSRRGHQTMTVDWDAQHNPTLRADIAKLTAKEITDMLGGKPDVIWAAPDCTTFSLLAMHKHRYQNNDGEMEAMSPYAKQCDKTDKHVLSLIKELQPKVYIIENPRGGMRTMKWMRPLGKPQTTTYCQYGMSYMKPTDFWSNIDLQLKPACKPGAPCHERSSRYRGGVVALATKVERSMYPDQLVRHMVDVCEQYMM